MEFRRLLPEPGTVTLPDVVAAVREVAAGGGDRPYTLANFVTTADGRASFSGRSGPLGDQGDRAMFHALREAADAVLAGTGTLGAERYGRLVRDPEARARRVAAGLEPEPLACVVTRRGDVPHEIPLFSEPEARVVVFSSRPVQIECAARLEVVELDPGELTLTTVLRHLRADHGVEILLCEGGPTIFGSLVTEGVVDELFLTIAPKLAGGGRGPTIASGPELAELDVMRLVWALEREASLYLRYRL